MKVLHRRYQTKERFSQSQLLNSLPPDAVETTV